MKKPPPPTEPPASPGWNGPWMEELEANLYGTTPPPRPAAAPTPPGPTWSEQLLGEDVAFTKQLRVRPAPPDVGTGPQAPQFQLQLARIVEAESDAALRSLVPDLYAYGQTYRCLPVLQEIWAKRWLATVGTAPPPWDDILSAP